jgi:parvulin-like peptidyl-prolyl isomerase
VALQVNDRAVSLLEIEKEFQDSLELLLGKVRKGQLPRQAWAAEIRKAWTSTLEDVVMDELLEQRGLAIRDKIIQWHVQQAYGTTTPERRMEQFKRLEQDSLRKLQEQRLEAAGGREALTEALKRKGQSYWDWEQDLKREIFRRTALYYSLGGPVHIGPRDAQAYYDANPDQFSTPDAWWLRRIKIPKDKFETPENALKAARAIHQKLTEGGDFAQIAANLPYDDEAIRQYGGMLNQDGKTGFPTGTFPLEETLALEQKLAPGQVSEPLDRDTYYLILKLDKYEEAKKEPFIEVRKKAEALAFNEKVKERKRAFSEKAKKEAFIQVLVEQPPEHYLKLVLRK